MRVRVELPPVPFVPGRCVNCDSDGVTLAAPLYCSPRCRQAAELVRYVRGVLADGRFELPDVKEAIQMRLAMVLGGGYPEAARRIPKSVRQTVFEKAAGRCENCGRPLDFDGSSGDPTALATIQHCAGNSGELEDLKAFCRGCNNADAQSRFVPVERGSAEDQLAKELQIRWLCEEPSRICDDHRRWRSLWQRRSAEAKEAIQARDEVEESAGCEELPDFVGYTEQGTPIQDG